MKKIVIISFVFCRLTAMSENECKQNATHTKTGRLCDWKLDRFLKWQPYDPFGLKIGNKRFVCKDVSTKIIDQYAFEKCLEALTKSKAKMTEEVNSAKN